MPLIAMKVDMTGWPWSSMLSSFSLGFVMVVFSSLAGNVEWMFSNQQRKIESASEEVDIHDSISEWDMV